ncbi:MAG: nucleotidyl transferase AbiEii/AbiGii toxin family protein [Lactobacillaceae bacterium]|jgi:predicted nucleotidyltransferase component of viral defense system|nr:nucleotidyl transferase AbiEii/AbiGii toxin family protein [Lactobacillaceae bacterium]
MSVNPNVLVFRYSRENKINVSDSYLRYLSQKIWERLSLVFGDQLIAKGGLIISEYLDQPSRVTKDMDATLLAEKYDENQLFTSWREALELNRDDGIVLTDISFVKERVTISKPIPGYLVKMKVELPSIDPQRPKKRVRLQISADVTIENNVVPKPQKLNFRAFAENETAVNVYPIEQIVAEKMQAILNHGERTTRMRDFADLSSLYDLYRNNISLRDLAASVWHQQLSRLIIFDYGMLTRIYDLLRENKNSQRLWDEYAERNGITTSFDQILDQSWQWFNDYFAYEEENLITS